MKLAKIALIVAMGLSGISVANAAASGTTTYDTGKVTFTGSIVDTPCSITPDTADQTVDLGHVSKTVLENAGVSQSTPFNIQLEDCDISTQSTVAVTFTGGADTNDNTLLGLNGTAAGAGIVIADQSGDQLDLGTQSQAQTLQNGPNTLQFSAWLKNDGAGNVVAGDFTSVANFQLAYQ
ncbi:fimbrial protein [Klebsiella aerogenes]|uniref:fimbrial protein n=1 Tax=Klebsiella aerogenes TaxID=548 RepID=UPI001F3D0802|nr:fimbrial protein [Klebsiella aerogenes]